MGQVVDKTRRRHLAAEHSGGAQPKPYEKAESELISDHGWPPIPAGQRGLAQQ